MSQFVLGNLLSEDIDKGGIEALKGFGFQHAAAIYIMYYLYLNDIKFEMYFETIEDLYFEIEEDKGIIKRYKAQVKKTKYTRNKLYTDDVIKKLISISGIDNYSVLLRNENFNTHPKSDDKVKLDIVKFLNIDAYLDKHQEIEIHLVELPFGPVADYQKAYICGLSSLYKKQNAFEMKEYFSSIYYLVQKYSSEEYVVEKNSITNKTLTKFENNAKAEIWLNSIVNKMNLKYSDSIIQSFLVEFRRLQQIGISSKEVQDMKIKYNLSELDTFDEIEVKLKTDSKNFVSNIACYYLNQYVEKEKHVI